MVIEMGYSVTVLMSTYNGEKYIQEQIESLFDQKNVEVNLIIRDDGSSDNTLDIINRLEKIYSIEVIRGKNVGYAKSFMQLVHYARKCKSEFFAFCDQDDVWESGKLITAINSIKNFKDVPALYLSQAKIVDEKLQLIENVSFHKRKVTLGAVLEHNYAIGCTMVFNAILREMLDIDLEEMVLDAGHDSWVYLVALAIGAGIHFDRNGYVLYRQHGNNASGKIVSIKQAFRAVNKVLFRWKHVRSSSALHLLRNYADVISERNMEILEIASKENKRFKDKIRFATDKRMYSDYLPIDVMFILAVLFNLF